MTLEEMIERHNEVIAENARLRGVVADCAQAPFETFAEVREYARKSYRSIVKGEVLETLEGYKKEVTLPPMFDPNGGK